MINKTVKDSYAILSILFAFLLIYIALNQFDKNKAQPVSVLADSQKAQVIGTKEYYVDIQNPQASDANPGTASLPFKTISYAYSLAAPGTTIIVMPGIYTEYQSGIKGSLQFSKSGTASQPIIIRSKYKGQAIIEGANDPNRRWGVTLGADYNILDGFEIRNAYVEGVVVEASYNQVLNNQIHHNGNIYNENDPTSPYYGEKSDGILSYPNVNGTLYMNNYIHHNGQVGSLLDHGLYLDGDNESVINNIITFNAASGIQISGYETVTNMKVYNNIISNNGTVGIMVYLQMNGIDIRNNIIYKNAWYGIATCTSHGTGVVIDHNLIYANGAGYGPYNMTWQDSDVGYTISNTLFTDPLFVNAPLDFHLQSSSPARNSGIALADVKTDINGLIRPQENVYDMGVYEYITQQYHPADSSLDWILDGTETTGYASCWKTAGCSWKGVPSTSIDASYVTNAGALWKAAGYNGSYHYNSASNPPWVSGF